MISIDNIVLCTNNHGVTHLENNVSAPLAVTLKKAEKTTLKVLVFDNDFDVNVVLAEAEAQVDLQLVYLANARHAPRISCTVTHLAEKTISRQEIKGVALDAAQVRFRGLIKIAPNAPKAQGRQHHRGLLIGPDAVIDAAPELEIDTDDVLCSHGSAIGSLDQAQLFYLMSRGLPEKEAKLFLIRSFLGNDLPEPLQTPLSDWMTQHV